MDSNVEIFGYSSEEWVCPVCGYKSDRWLKGTVCIAKSDNPTSFCLNCINKHLLTLGLGVPVLQPKAKE